MYIYNIYIYNIYVYKQLNNFNVGKRITPRFDLATLLAGDCTCVSTRRFCIKEHKKSSST